MLLCKIASTQSPSIQVYKQSQWSVMKTHPQSQDEDFGRPHITEKHLQMEVNETVPVLHGCTLNAPWCTATAVSPS